MKRIGLLYAVAVSVLGSACALHREPVLYGCTLPGYVECFDGDAECLRKVREKYWPERFSYAVVSEDSFGTMAERVAKDFDVLLAKTAAQYRYVAWVTWEDGSYGVLFSDEQAWITITGIHAPSTGSVLSLGYNNRLVAQGRKGVKGPEVTIRVRNRDSLADLDLEFRCVTPISGHAHYHVPHPVPMR